MPTSECCFLSCLLIFKFLDPKLKYLLLDRLSETRAPGTDLELWKEALLLFNHQNGMITKEFVN